MSESSRALRILVAPSGFKECLSAERVAAAITRGVRRAGGKLLVVEECPLADGGEGTAASMARVTNGTLHDVRVTGPTGEPVNARFAMLGGEASRGKTAVVDLAAAAGLQLVPKDRRNPLATTSRGVGELIAAALDAGAAHIVVGCGDSGVSDGGAGRATALGVKLLDKRGEPIGPGGGALAGLDRIDLDGRDERLRHVTLDVACNIKNVLTGEKGVARVFGPQKGASEEDVERLAEALDNFAAVVERDCGVDVRSMPGGGASGGAGAGLHALLGAALHSRFDLLFPFFGIDDAIGGADVIVTAEGGVDFKSAAGKIPAELGARGRRLGKPVVILAGTVGKGAEDVLERGVTALFSIQPGPQSLDEAMEHAEGQLAQMGEQVTRLLLAAAETRLG